jgi:hypothetical protein
MFNVTPGMLQAWEKRGNPKASPMDIARLQAIAQGRLSPSYIEFVMQYGFVVFGRDPERTKLFTYTIDSNGQREVRQETAGFLQTPDNVATTYTYVTTTDDPDDETRPMLPEGYLTIGRDVDHGFILLDFLEQPGRIRYQPRTDWRWGTEDNTWLGDVAPDFESFINGLRPDPL